MLHAVGTHHVGMHPDHLVSPLLGTTEKPVAILEADVAELRGNHAEPYLVGGNGPHEMCVQTTFGLG